jgi:amino acid adenylation domain-containing protein
MAFLRESATRTAPDLLHRVFEAHARGTPDAVAIRDHRSMVTYGELNGRANRLAVTLRSAGVHNESIVGISLTRSIDLVVAMLGVLKAGGAFLVLDPTHPEHRLRQIVEDAQPSLRITAPATDSHGPVPSVRVDAADAVDCGDDEALATDVEPSSLAYVMYTSGTTGGPKGVLLSHHALSNYAVALSALRIAPDDVHLAMASPMFSSSVRQLLIPLCFGASVAIATADDIAEPIRLQQFIAIAGVTIVDVVPSYWRVCTRILAQLPQERRAALLDNRVRLVLSASEPLPSDLPRIWRRDFKHPAAWMNGYGHTETTGLVSLLSVADASLDSTPVIPIGRPLANTWFEVLDDDGHQVSVDQTGELHIQGTSLARGYLNRPQLDAERFVAVPGAAGERRYRTGDLMRVRSDLTLEFVGRRDLQVKLNGVRIELPEIEAALRQHPSVDDAAVVLGETVDDRQLVAYVVTEHTDVPHGDLRDFLLQRLPATMVPGVITKIATLPRTPSGKIDRAGLKTLATGAQAPASDVALGLEQEIAAEWRRVLRLPQVDVGANFFELGGESVKAMELIAALQQRFPTDVPMLALFFEEPTVAALARAIQDTSSRDTLTGVQPSR